MAKGRLRAPLFFHAGVTLSSSWIDGTSARALEDHPRGRMILYRNSDRVEHPPFIVGHRIVIPELDLVVATFGGHYADGLYLEQELTPNQILPAVRELGDDSDTPVIPGNFETPHG